MPGETPRSHRRILLVLLVVSALAAAFFTVRGVVQLVYWSDPAHLEQPLEPWMTVGFVARSYGLDRTALAAALGLETAFGRRLTLETLAADRGQSFDAFAADLETAIQTARQQ